MSTKGSKRAVVSLFVAAAWLLSAIPADSASSLTRVSRASPFANCTLLPLPRELNYLNAEVEPWVAINPRNPANQIGVWQQDRWARGGARGLMTGVSRDGGETWHDTFAHFTTCSGGTPTNKGNYERASDPWVTISPNGVAHQIALSFDFVNDANQAILVSNSTNDGTTWSEPIPLIADTDPSVVDDKESITADPRNSDLVYAVWDRLEFTDASQTVEVRGPTLFSRTTDGGKTWSSARVIFDPGVDAQTIANQIVVLPNGDLLNLAVQILQDNEPVSIFSIVVLRSTDKGVTWSAPITVNSLQSIGVTDPKTGEPLRTGDIIPNIAVSRETGTVFVVWQDARFSGGQRDGIAFATSHDGGRTWSAAKQINKVPQVQAFTAAVHVADDKVGVTYYDLRHDNADRNVLLTDYWLTQSDNEGRTFHEKHVAGPFDMRTAPVARGFFVGDYEGLGNVDEQFVPFFVMTNSGNLNNRTDVFAAPADEEFDGGADHETVVAPRNMHELVLSHRENRRER